MNRPQLNELIGQDILARIPSLQRDSWVRVKLHSAESAGIWIETQSVTDACLEFLHTSASDKICLLFIPFAQVLSILFLVDGVSLSESVLGL